MPVSEDFASIKYTCILLGGKNLTAVLIKMQIQIPTKPDMFTPTQHFTIMDKQVSQRVIICVDLLQMAHLPQQIIFHIFMGDFF